MSDTTGKDYADILAMVDSKAGLLAVQQRLTAQKLADVVDMIGQDPYTLDGNLKSKKKLMSMIMGDMTK